MELNRQKYLKIKLIRNNKPSLYWNRITKVNNHLGQYQNVIHFQLSHILKIT